MNRRDRILVPMAQGQRSYITLWGISPIDVGAAFLVAMLYFLNRGPIALLYPENSAASPALESFSDVVIGLLYSVPMAFRRTHSVPSAVLIFTASGWRHFLEPSNIISADVAVLASLYAVTVYGPVWAHRTVAAASVLGDFLLTIPTLTSQATVPNGATSWSTFSNSFTYIGAVLAAVYGLALARRSQFQEMNSLIVQARDAEHRADTEAELAVLEERSRIAREMHDIVAHTLSVVIAQADGGRYAAKKDPQAPLVALATISDMARDALKDIRSIIGVLRDAEGNEQPTLPQPVEHDLEELVRTVHESGITVSFVRTGETRPLPVGVGNAIYRICQEALTNSLKHAGPRGDHDTAPDHGRRADPPGRRRRPRRRGPLRRKGARPGRHGRARRRLRRDRHLRSASQRRLPGHRLHSHSPSRQQFKEPI